MAYVYVQMAAHIARIGQELFIYSSPLNDLEQIMLYWKTGACR